MGYMPTLPDYPGVSQMRHCMIFRSPVQVTKDVIHSTKIFGNFGPKLNGSVWSNGKSFKKMGPPFGWNKWIEWITPQISKNKWTFELFCALV